MSDHLHLNLPGYQELGMIFYDKINELNLLPEGNPLYSYSKQDSITRKNYHFTKLDSIISHYKIEMLKNDWPFIDQNKKKSTLDILTLNNRLDSLAYDYVSGKLKWEKAQRELGLYYFNENAYDKGKEIFDNLISQYTFVVEYYQYLSEKLIIQKKFDLRCQPIQGFCVV